MAVIILKDKKFGVSITAKEIDAAIRKVSDQINRDYEGKNILFLPILNGSFMFTADLLRKIRIPCQVTFVKYASYSGISTTTQVTELIGINESVASRHVVILEDIVDTGITMDLVLNELKKFHPADVRIACMFHKPEAFVKSFKIDYLGMNIPNEFVVGFGLDYDGYGRNYADVYRLVK
ncbi:MAG: hypoxanthine phosphoribosyltransferase [Bacteroidetes bacterium]|nr:hypoxanthine phosphoribosyltransferase [Bacteroidota bacterium]